MILALLGKHGRSAAMVDANDRLSIGRIARVGDMAIVEYPGDQAKGEFRHIDLFLVEGEQGKSFKLDGCLFSLRETHFASPLDFKFCFVRDPGAWRNDVSIGMIAALKEEFALRRARSAPPMRERLCVGGGMRPRHSRARRRPGRP